MIEYFVKKYGEKFRTLITDALNFIDGREPVWGVAIDREQYIAALLDRYVEEKPQSPPNTVFKIEWEKIYDGATHPDGLSLHLTEQDARLYASNYWQAFPNPSTRPYGGATPFSPKAISVDDTTYQQVSESEYGIRLWPPYLWEIQHD